MQVHIQISKKLNIPAGLYRILLFFLLLYRRLRFGHPFRLIPLTQDKFAIVDPSDYARLSLYKWHASKGRHTYYAQRKITDPVTKTQRTIKMHRAILNAPPFDAVNVVDGKLLVDHINHNGLDNRKANLRPATHSQNTCNIPKSNFKTSSKYKGVSWHKQKKKWYARVRIKGQHKSIGYFKNETQAAKAYDHAAKKLQGQFASTNFKYKS